MKNKTCCFTGKRPQNLPFGFNENDPNCKKIKAELKAKIEEAIQNGYKHFIGGMALGVDIWAFEALLKLKQKYTTITLEAAIPHEEQPKSWNEEQRNRYYDILAKCDKVTLLGYRYTPDCYHKRNRYMIDNSSLLIAVHDGNNKGGTAFTVNYAKDKEVKVHIIRC